MKFQIIKAPNSQAILVRTALNQYKSAISYFEKLVSFAEEEWKNYKEEIEGPLK